MKGHFKYPFLLAAICLLPFLSYGQKEPLYTQYMFNLGSFNPAYAASVTDPEITFAYRAQWVGLDGSPATFRLGYVKAFPNGKNGLGFNISRDEIGPSAQTFFDVAYSFQIPVGRSTYLSMGIDGGASLLNIDFSKGNFQAPGEPLLNQVSSNNFYPTVGAGLFLYDLDWYAGLSVPNFLASSLYSEELKSLTPEQLQFDMVAGWVYTSPTEMFKLKPAILMSYTKGVPLNVNISTTALISNMVTIGASYRLQNSISGIAGIQVSPALFVGYAYDYNTTNLGEYSGASHEVVLKFFSGRKWNRPNRNRPSKNGQVRQIDSPRFF